jgi:hypothetical protein
MAKCMYKLHELVRINTDHSLNSDFMYLLIRSVWWDEGKKEWAYGGLTFIPTGPRGEVIYSHLATRNGSSSGILESDILGRMRGLEHSREPDPALAL